MTHTKLLLSTLQGKKSDHIPIWLMRQAGRYLPEYRAIREKVGFLELCQNPELACEVTLQPIRRFGMDGAILFSDILVPLMPMGFELSFGKDHGPKISNPIRSGKDLQAIRVAQGEECSYVGETLKLLARALPPQVTLIGFAGAPFTLASYVVEGGSSRQYLEIKKLMYTDPLTFKSLMEKITATTISYLHMQVKAGAEALQIFDSWAGQLSPQDYRDYAHPYTCKIIDALSPHVPVIHFAKNGGGLLPTLAQSPAPFLGIGWEADLFSALQIIRPNKGIQGNLDPATLLAPTSILEKNTLSILKLAAGSPHPFIFNLGHGIHPETSPESVKYLIDLVKNFQTKIP